MPSRNFRLNTKGLSAQLNTFNPRMHRAIGAAFEYQKERSEGRMRTGARWTDRTGNARSSLFAATTNEGNSFKLLVSHGVSYGIYLEASNSGKYSIVIPEILLAGEDLMRLCSKLLATIPKKA